MPVWNVSDPTARISDPTLFSACWLDDFINFDPLFFFFFTTNHLTHWRNAVYICCRDAPVSSIGTDTTVEYSTRKIHAVTMTLITDQLCVYVYDNRVKSVFVLQWNLGQSPPVLQKHAEKCCWNSRTSVGKLNNNQSSSIKWNGLIKHSVPASLSNVMQVLVLYSFCKTAVSVHP